MQPRVGRHVRLGQFSAEVLGPTATASAEPASPRSVVQLALRGHLDGGKIRTYRMEKQAFEVLRQCDGGRSLGGIWAEAAFSEPDDALKLVRFALTESLLCLDECPDGA
jgi:hypothetical protein